MIADCEDPRLTRDALHRPPWLKIDRIQMMLCLFSLFPLTLVTNQSQG